MAFQKSLGAFPWEGLNEDRSRVRQRQHEQGDLGLVASQANRGFAEIDLGLTWWMRQGQKNFLVRLLPPNQGFSKTTPFSAIALLAIGEDE